MKMPEPVAYCSVRPLQGDESAPKFEVSWVGRRPIAGPLYDKQALIDLLEEAAKYADEMGMITAPEIRAMKETL